MIIGLGTDIVEPARFESWIGDDALCSRYFHEDEVAYALNRADRAAEVLAARFAAKEAFAKALGTGFFGLVLRDIRVANDDRGRPELILTGSAKQKLAELGVRTAHLTLAHERYAAVATVILEA